MRRLTRVSCGAISLSIASHLLAMLASKSNRPVMLPVRCAMLVTNPEPIGVDQSDETRPELRWSRA